MIWWLIPIAYAVIGAMLIPRFTRPIYRATHQRWHMIQSKETSLKEAVGDAWLQSLVWPIFLIISIAVERITAEERFEAEEKARAKTVEGARAVIARFEAEEKRKWDANFRNGGIL